MLGVSCTTTKIEPVQDEPKIEQQEEKKESVQKISEISMIFAGDIMAHKPNYAIGKFARIWWDIAPLVKTGSLSFANMEAPVAENLPWSTYPEFNMHQSYPEAAINAGFNVFSLANNHTNDQYLDGIKATRVYFANRKGVWACGLKEKSGAPLTYQLIEKDGWKVLFVAFTEILNRNDYASYIDFYPAKRRKALKESLSKLAAENPHDVFVISVHSSEPEYVHEIADERRSWYMELVSECGADVIWANHPHIVRPWEQVTLKETGRTAFIMYGNGNTISAQRYSPTFSNPEKARDDTGDGVIIRLTFSKTNDEKPVIKKSEHFFITTMISTSGQYVIRLLDDDLIHSLERAELTTWSAYLKARRRILETQTGVSK